VEDTEAKAREFVRTYPMTFAIGFDWSLKVATPLGFRGMPYTVVISPGGAVARRFVGPVSEADLVAAIEALRPAR
jgi:hypothetical protein